LFFFTTIMPLWLHAHSLIHDTNGQPSTLIESIYLFLTCPNTPFLSLFLSHIFLQLVIFACSIFLSLPVYIVRFFKHSARLNTYAVPCTLASSRRIVGGNCRGFFLRCHGLLKISQCAADDTNARSPWHFYITLSLVDMASSYWPFISLVFLYHFVLSFMAFDKDIPRPFLHRQGFFFLSCAVKDEHLAADKDGREGGGNKKNGRLSNGQPRIPVREAETEPEEAGPVPLSEQHSRWAAQPLRGRELKHEGGAGWI
jgi:hypothetical protein